MPQYIYQAIDAARALLSVCSDLKHALPYLPSRYLLWTQFAAVFILKVSPRSFKLAEQELISRTGSLFAGYGQS